ncbi:hypothetical protein T261_1404 [Streptomyces lydicus]|nr:hypothetical protein T261_1404 [Streptomyces lydicus]
MHAPSLPEDLERPERLWARALTLAVLEKACTHWKEHALDEHGLWCHSTGAGGWWRLTVLDGGRAVFVGQDPDGSHTHVGGRGIDFLAGGPDWLPWDQLREDEEGNLFGFVYWWENDAWHRIPYPDEVDEDGLDGAAPWVGSEEEFLSLAAALGADGLPPERRTARFEATTRFRQRVEDGTADEAAVVELLDAACPDGTPPERRKAALDIAARAGVTGARTPT